LFFTTHAHTHPFNGPFSGTTRVSRYQKGKPIWILLKQETASSSDINWVIIMQVCTSLQTDNHASTHHSRFFTGRICPSCRPTNSVKALNVKFFLQMPVKFGAWFSKCWPTRTIVHKQRIGLGPSMQTKSKVNSKCVHRRLGFAAEVKRGGCDNFNGFSKGRSDPTPSVTAAAVMLVRLHSLCTLPDKSLQ